MHIGGFQHFSLSDFPERIAAIVFTQGCNMCCWYCHNKQLISTGAGQCPLIQTELVLKYLENRAGRLDGVVVTGGEPTLHDDLAQFLDQLKAVGLAVKLNTNGSRPKVLERLIRDRLLDYVAMDVKAPLDSYDRIVGCRLSEIVLRRSIRLIAGSGVAHEFRTTAVPSLTDTDLCAIAGAIPSNSRHYIQPYRPPTPAKSTMVGGGRR